MKNIEYYQNTKDALEAWRQSVEGREYLSFVEWVQREYETPRVPTLLEAAEAVADEWYTADVSGGNIVNLKNAIDREKEKPVRNFDKYKTAKEALSAYRQMCRETYCRKCQHEDGGFDYAGCSFNWLYADAAKEKAK